MNSLFLLPLLYNQAMVDAILEVTRHKNCPENIIIQTVRQLK